MAPVINSRNFYNNLFNTKFMKKMLPANTTKAASTLALISTVTKDALNCYYYTTQSYHNKKIPEDKRKFVAALDLSNGIVNVVVPIISKPLIDKASESMFKKHFEKLFNENAASAMFNKLRGLNIDCDLKSVEDILGKTSLKWAKAGFSVIATLVASQIICKRIITPSVATPLADVFKKMFENNEKKAKAKAEGNSAAVSDIKKADDSSKQEVADASKTMTTSNSPSVYILDGTTFGSFDKFITNNINHNRKN